MNASQAGFQRRRLYVMSALGLVMAGVNASLRANVAGDLQRLFLDPIDPANSAKMIANVLGVPFLGFALTIALGSLLLDSIGMSLLFQLSGVMFTVGMLLILFAQQLAHFTNVYHVLVAGAFCAGIGWGLVETVVNPLITSLFPEQKTAKLNAVHAWWPGGLVIGGLAGVLMSKIGLSWQAKLVFAVVPALVLVVGCLGLKFPPTERAASGVSTKAMLNDLKSPIFLVLFCSMFLTAASELAPGQWVDIALSRTVHMPGILLLVYVSGLMFVMRHFAGALGRRFSPTAVLWCSCLMASIGLIALSFANSPVTGLLAATIWGTGVCYMWPTMLATASERFPRGGALLMGLMGTAGTLSIQFVLPFMGSVFDSRKIAVAGGLSAFERLMPGPELERVLGVAAQASFRVVAIFPAVLLLVFGGLWLYDRSQGGYKQVRINPVLEETTAQSSL
jgi:MFS family permease